MPTVLDAARCVAEDYPGGAHALAARIDKPPSTFAHELAGAGGAKLGLKTAVAMSTRTGDMRILNAFAAELGAMVLPLPVLSIDAGEDALRLVGDMAREFGDVVAAYSAALADGKVTANELAHLGRQWGELEVVAQRMLAHATAVHEAAKPKGDAALRKQLEDAKSYTLELEGQRDRLTDILSRTAIAPKGPEPELTKWSWHDLPKLAEEARKDADNYWNDDDRERNYSSISEFLNDKICNGTPIEVGSTFTLLRAVSLPKITIRVTSVDEEECEADYEIVGAAIDAAMKEQK